jgi:UDP-GlcNAc:undecaprenyl-phosphate GlcNAc-1-phosphate transferase
MASNLIDIFPIFKALFVSLFLVLVLAWISIHLSRQIRLIDFPGSAPHKLHTRPTPMAGGIAMLATLLISEYFLGGFRDPGVKATFLAVLPVFLFGLWDDYKNLPPGIKLIGQFSAALILIHSGVMIRIFESPGFFIHGQGVGYVYLDWLITVFWVVGITNALNFVDSMDGLAVGLSGLAAAFFMLVTLASGQSLLSQHSTLILGVCIGLFYYNSSPALLFLGDAGAQSLGFILAVLAIVYAPQGANQSSSWLIPILLLAVPIFDATFVIFSRLRRKRAIYTAARDHTYHRLLSLGLESNRAVLVMHLAALLLSCVAFLILNQTPLIANFTFGCIAFLGMVAIALLDRIKICS